MPPEIVPMGESDKGSLVQLAGWGRIDKDLPVQLERRSGTAIIDEVSATKLRLIPKPATACIGDSGGPVFGPSTGLIAIIVSGDDSCQSYTSVARADVFWPFVESVLSGRRGEGCAQTPRTRTNQTGVVIVLLLATCLFVYGQRKSKGLTV
jgi:hypothetical protein